MNKQASSLTLIAGFSVFTMLFGAGNFMVPPSVGIFAGQKSLLAASAFMITAVILPLIGLLGMFLFGGDYRAYFNRLGTVMGTVLIALCMFIIGPGLVLPRIVNVCFEMLSPFVPGMSLLVYSILLAMITFFLAYKPSRLLDVLGYVITPIKLTFVAIIILLGLYAGKDVIVSSVTTAEVFGKSLLFGYETLDLLGTLFFGSVIVSVLRKNLGDAVLHDKKTLLRIGAVSSLIGGSLLAVVYVGLMYLGAYHGAGLEGYNQAQILSKISLRVVGPYGGFFGALALMIACLATMIALATVITEYTQREIVRNRLSYVPCLILILISTVILSLLGLQKLMNFSRDLAFILYPVLITLTFCNIAYKMWGVKTVKLPVYAVLLGSLFIKFDGVEFCMNCIKQYASPIYNLQPLNMKEK